MKNTLKRAVKSFLVISLAILLIVISAFILGNIYKEEIKNYVIREINKEINVKIQVNSVYISMFRKFPYVSVILKNATAWSGKKFDKKQFAGIDTDTLFTASTIYLQFNLYDILHKNYRLRRVHALNGKINLLTDRYGLVNYRLFKQEKKKGQKSAPIALDMLKISKFTWKFKNLSKNIQAIGYVKDISLKGRFANTDFSLSTEGSIMINDFSGEDIQFAENMNVGLKVNMEVHDSIYKINKGELSLNNMDFRVSGSFTSRQKTSLALELGAIGVDIKSFFISLPVEIKSIEQFTPSGKIDLLARISGEISRTLVPDIRAAFKLMNGKIYLSKAGITIEGINLKGAYSNGTMHTALSSSINISEYKFINGRSTHLKGSFLMENFKYPFLKADISGKVDAHILSKIISIPGLKIEKGFFLPDVSVTAGLAESKNFQIDKIVTSSISGKFLLDGISGDLPGLNEHVDFLAGKINVEGDTWYPDLTVKTGTSDIRLNIQADHVLGYFMFKKTSLWLKGDLYSHYFDLKKFVSKKNESDTILFKLPEKLYIQFNYATDGLDFGKFRAENIISTINYKPGFLAIPSLNLKTMKGKITANGILTMNANGSMNIKSQGILDKIDINELFYTFNNFTQKFIVEKNLRGLISGDIQLNIELNNKLKPDYSTLTLNSDIRIINGELLDFEPIKSLSGFVALSELEHIKFSSLQNSILIKDSKVYIPKMDINSSAFNITTSGIHGFDNYFEYKIKVNLSEILARKARKAKKENEEFGVVENDGSGGTSLYLAITGTPDNYKIRYDKKEAGIKIKNDLQNEKKVLKSILKEEFGFFKKDTVGNKLHNSKQENTFILDWGEEDNTPIDKKESKKTKEKPEFKMTWEK
jgi:hypothetical protein